MTVRGFSPDLVLLEMSPRKHWRRFLAKRCSSATLPCKGRAARAFARAGWGEPKRCISERVRASIAGRSEGDQVEVSHEPVARGAPTLPLQGGWEPAAAESAISQACARFGSRFG